MESLYFLIPLAMVILLVIVVFFFWAVRSGQMDDLEGPAYRILMDDEHEGRAKKGKREAAHPANSDEGDSGRH